MLELPAPFGKYHLLERLAVGGMAEVFLAKAFGAAGFERLLVIKKILPHMAEDEEFITMFIDEARIASTLNHSNIIQITELGKEANDFYIAMEYCMGKDLSKMHEKLSLQKRTTPIPLAVLIASRICEGLEYAHRKKDSTSKNLNIIHRDVSPGNVLVSYDGDVKLIDFGIAKAQNRMGRTTAGTLKGKFGYMSPEQVRGHKLDHRSDIFSVGILLYEMLTGERLFGAESDFGTLEKVRKAQVVPPTTYNSKIPKDLERVVLQSLAREPEERYECASDMQEDLMRFLMHEGSLTTSKSLSAFVRDLFQQELEKENDKLSLYRKRGYPWLEAAKGQQPEAVGSTSVQALRQQAAPAPDRRDAAEASSPADPAQLPTQIFPKVDPQQPAPAGSPPSASTPSPSVEVNLGDVQVHQPTVILSQGAAAVAESEDEEPGDRRRPGPEQEARRRVAPNRSLQKRPGAKAAAARKVGPRSRKRARELAAQPARKPSPMALAITIGVGLAVIVVVGLLLFATQKSPAPQGAAFDPALTTTALPKAPAQSGASKLDFKSLASGAEEPDKDEPKTADGKHAGAPGQQQASSASPPTQMPTGPPRPEPKEQLRRPDAQGRDEPIAVDSATKPKPAVAPRRKPAVRFRPKKDKRISTKKVALASNGQIELKSSPPGAEIFLNGKRRGTTPATLGGLDTSRGYFVVLRKAGYRKFYQRIKLEGKRKALVDATLQAEQGQGSKSAAASKTTAASCGNDGYLVANTTPWARVIIDGRDTGKWTPVAGKQKITLKAGKHVVTFRTKEGKKLTVRVDIQACQTSKLIKKIL